MKGFGPGTFGERWADVYDTWTGSRSQRAGTDEAVGTLASLAGAGPVLELAIGTGRLALPLAARGLRVEGIDASEEMLAALRRKPGGEAIPVTVGDFADVGVDGAFGLVFVAFNTLFNLTTQDAQVRCFRNAAARLAPGGCFVVEAFVPDPASFADGQSVRAVDVDLDSAVLEVARHDAASQEIRYQYVVLTGEGVQVRPLHCRYAWPAELDLMARLAGLALRERWSGWDRAPFGPESRRHVSVYARPHPSRHGE